MDFFHISLWINRIIYELTLSLSYEYALVTAHNISILIWAVHRCWAIVCVFILLYFLATCTLVNNECWQVDRACFFYPKKFTKHTKCIYIDVWIDVWRLAIAFSFSWDDLARLFRWTENGHFILQQEKIQSDISQQVSISIFQKQFWYYR